MIKKHGVRLATCKTETGLPHWSRFPHFLRKRGSKDGGENTGTI